MSEVPAKHEVIPADAHHPFGPSRWPALVECGHYEGRPGGADAARGTALHELFAKAALGAAGEESAADTFERHAVLLGLHVRELAEQAGGADKLMVEQTVTCPPVPGGEPEGAAFVADAGGFIAPEVFGRLDAAWWDGAELHVADLKTADNPERDYTPQLVAYAFGLAEEWGVEPSGVSLHLLCVETNRDKVSAFDWPTLSQRYAEFRARIVAVALGRKDEPKQCGWCPLCAHYEACRACRDVAETVDQHLSDIASPERWAALTPARKARFCVLAETVAKWAEAVKKAAGDDAKAGVAIEDPEAGIFYGLQEKKGRLDLDTDLAWEVAKKCHISRESYVACLKVDPTKFKQLLASWHKRRDVEEMLETCGTRGKPTLAFVRKGAK